ncbi:MAG: anthranilate phosphoribosyltransferase [Chloroflexi bacterium]|nr:anthranilate phosphoribosyltransferase [Chloroflexota bacterium]
MGIQHAIRKVSQQQDLTRDEAHAAMQDIMSGQATAAQIGGYLIGLRLKGETVDEITGSAQAMREVANPAPIQAANAIDTCGTGGDATNTFNISTTVAFVAAAAGVPVAKHGNRAVSSRSGSADVLATLGVNLNLTPEQSAQCVDAIGVGFMFAPAFHPAMKHAIGPRRELAVRTIFNILGPLTNPAGVNRQVLGVFSPSLTATLAGVLQALGSQAVFVVHGVGGLDEFSTLGSNHVAALRDGVIETYELDPAAYGLAPTTLEQIQGGDAETNATITRDVLGGKGTQAQREIVMLNAAAALVVGGIATDIADGLQQAAEVLDSGRALDRLDALIDVSNKLGAKD